MRLCHPSTPSPPQRGKAERRSDPLHREADSSATRKSGEEKQFCFAFHPQSGEAIWLCHPSASSPQSGEEKRRSDLALPSIRSFSSATRKSGEEKRFGFAIREAVYREEENEQCHPIKGRYENQMQKPYW
jgi:hypothetical protein